MTSLASLPGPLLRIQMPKQLVPREHPVDRMVYIHRERYIYYNMVFFKTANVLSVLFYTCIQRIQHLFYLKRFGQMAVHPACNRFPCVFVKCIGSERNDGNCTGIRPS